MLKPAIRLVAYVFAFCTRIIQRFLTYVFGKRIVCVLVLHVYVNASK